jgi:hypothetical protein
MRPLNAATLFRTDQVRMPAEDAKLSNTGRARRLTPTTCAVCNHPQKELIEAHRAAGASLSALAVKFAVSRDSVWRHWRDHVSADLKISYLAGPAMIEQLKERARAEGGTVLDYLTVLRSLLMGALTSTSEVGSGFVLANLSGKLLDVLKEIGRITGEIERISGGVNVTTNIAIMSDPRMIDLQTGLLTIARAHPQARSEIVKLLRTLDAGPLPKPNGGLHAGALIEGEAVHVS